MAILSHCPSDQQLQDLLLGRGHSQEAAEWEVHLLSCEICARRAAELPADDDLIRSVRRSAMEKDTPEPEVVSTLVSVFKRVDQAPNSQLTVNWSGQPSPTSPTEGFLAPAQQPDELGRLGPYSIQSVLGAGGMGIVYRGYDPQLKRAIALKVVQPELLKSPGMRDSFLEEARAAAAVEHDNILPIYAVETHDDVPCIIMPLLQGETLDSYLKANRNGLSLGEVLRLGREAATGLAIAHARGLIHRDIKPGNLWLEEGSRRLKILDFGLAIPQQKWANSGSFAGTPGYMSPEQASGKAVDVRSDLFSLGCVLFRAATGEEVFTADTPLSKIVQAISDELPEVKSRSPKLLPELAQLLNELLAHDPNQRPASAQVVLDRLQLIEAKLNARQQRFTRRMWLGGVATALVLGGFVAWAAIQPKKPVEPTVKLEVKGDSDLGAVILERDGLETVLNWPRETSVELLPGSYTLRLVKPISGRLLMPASVTILPGEPRTIQMAFTGEVDRHQSHSSAVTGVAAITSPNGFTCLSVSLDRTLTSWEPGQPTRFAKLESPAQAMSVSANGLFVAVAGGNRTEPFDTSIHLFNGQTLTKRGTLTGHTRRIQKIAGSSDGQQVLTAALGELWLWDVKSGQKRTLETERDNLTVTALAFDPQRHQAISGDEEGYLYLWNLDNGKLLKKLIAQTVGASGNVTALAYTPNGFASTGQDGVIRLWNRETFQARELLPLKKPVRALASLGGAPRLLSAGDDGIVRLWDVVEGRLLYESPNLETVLRGVAFSPDGRNAIVGGEDHTVRVIRLPY